VPGEVEEMGKRLSSEAFYARDDSLGGDGVFDANRIKRSGGSFRQRISDLGRLIVYSLLSILLRKPTIRYSTRIHFPNTQSHAILSHFRMLKKTMLNNLLHNHLRRSM